MATPVLQGYDYPRPAVIPDLGLTTLLPASTTTYTPTTTTTTPASTSSITTEPSSLCEICCRYPELSEYVECPRCSCDQNNLIFGFGAGVKCLKTLACG